MKRVISFFLVIILCCYTFSSCDIIDKSQFLESDKANKDEINSSDGTNDDNNAEGENNIDEKLDNNENINNDNSENNDNNVNDDNNSDNTGENDDSNSETEKPDYVLVEDIEKVDVPDRFKATYTIDYKKLENAAAAACAKLKAFGESNNASFVDVSSINHKYKLTSNKNWISGMYTGSYLMAYQLTGDSWFSDVVNRHINSYIERETKKIGMDDHDVGFVFMPSCVGAYKVLGNENARDAALRAVEYYYKTSYSREGKFIIRSHKTWESGSGCRTMIDSMMNSSLFFWANSEIDVVDYFNAGKDHTYTTIDLIIRDDGSTYHHYQFDPLTAKPVRGLTFQGYSDESCWSRGHSWGIYGFSIAYSYVNSKEIMDAQREVTYYMLNHLPSDLIPYWDYTFTSGDQPRDASAAAIAICGMLDMAGNLPEDSAQRLIYESAAAQMMESLIDNCTGDIGIEYDGLIHSVTHALPQNRGIEECAPYADYFYLEALARFLKHDFIRPW